MREPHLYPRVHVHMHCCGHVLRSVRFSHGHPAKGQTHNLRSQTPRDAPSHTHTVTLEVSRAYTDACLHMAHTYPTHTTPHSYTQLAAHK